MSVKTRSPPYPVQKPAIGKSQSYSPDPSIPSPHVHAEPLDHVSDTCVGAGSLKLGLQKTVPRYRDTCYAPRWGTVRDPALPRWNPPSVDNTGTVAEPFLPHSQHLSYPNPSIDHHHYQPWPTQMCWTPMATSLDIHTKPSKTNWSSLQGWAGWAPEFWCCSDRKRYTEITQIITNPDVDCSKNYPTLLTSKITTHRGILKLWSNPHWG